MEPMSTVTKITKAKLKLAVQTGPRMYQIEPFVQKNTPDELPKDYLTRFGPDSKTSPMKPSPLYLGPVINLPLTMKHEIAKQPFKYRPLYTEVGLVLDDILNAVAQGKPYGEPEQPLLNRAMEERIKQREKELKDWQESERKRLNRQEYLHNRVKALTQRKGEQDKKKEEEEKQKPKELSKKEQEWIRYHEEQKEKIKEHREKVAAEKEAEEEKEKERKWKEREIKKRRFQDFNSKKIGELVIFIFLSSKDLN